MNKKIISVIAVAVIAVGIVSVYSSDIFSSGKRGVSTAAVPESIIPAIPAPSAATTPPGSIPVSRLMISSESASVGACAGKGNPLAVVACQFTMSFTLTNSGNSPVFVNKDPARALATAAVPNISTTMIQFINIPSVAGDTASAYVMAPQSSRRFIYSGTISRPAAGGLESFKVAAIKYGLSGTALDQAITSGLGSLSVSKTF